MSPFEVGMLACFGVSWPFSVYKTWKAKMPTGKSMGFLWLVFIGYVSGVLHKIFYHLDFVILLYILNGTLVMVDIMLCYYYSKHPGGQSGGASEDVAIE